MKKEKVVEYKNRKYLCLFLGATKYGRRAHLAFFDRSKDFWVSADLVTESATRDSYGDSVGNGDSYRRGVTAPHGRTCPECGSRECARAWNPRDLCDED